VRGDAEVDQLDVRLAGQQNIVTFDISVHAVLLVQIHQRLQTQITFISVLEPGKKVLVFN